MARRRKTSTFEDIVYIASRLPWWLSLIIALGAWFFFHSVATSPVAPLTDPKQYGDMITGQVFRSLSLFLQYIIPVAFCFGAIGSLFGRFKRRKLMGDVASAIKPGKTIEGISWQQFEQLTGEAFRRQGFTVTETGGNGPDGGIDLVLHKDGEKYLVQCKQWRSLKVGVAVIREFFECDGCARGCGWLCCDLWCLYCRSEVFCQWSRNQTCGGRRTQSLDSCIKKRSRHTANNNPDSD